MARNPRTGSSQRSSPKRSNRIQIIVALAIAAVTSVGIIALATMTSREPAATSPTGSTATTSTGVEPEVQREDSRVMGQPGTSGVTLVEFLDFECEACGAWFPVVEAIREQYDGQVSFIHRYFPLPGHANSMNAALAVEAAGQQGKYTEMVTKMYTTQAEWGEQQDSKADVFRGFADELGLDLAAFDASVADPATRSRIEKDIADGEGLGVPGTPTFFLQGQLIQPGSPDELLSLIESSLASTQ